MYVKADNMYIARNAAANIWLTFHELPAPEPDSEHSMPGKLQF